MDENTLRRGNKSRKRIHEKGHVKLEEEVIRAGELGEPSLVDLVPRAEMKSSTLL